MSHVQSALAFLDLRRSFNQTRAPCLRMKTTALALAVLAFSALPVTAAVTTYQVTQTYNQVVYDVSHPDWDTVFTGTFRFDDVTRTVTGLAGRLSQAMDGAPVPGAANWIDLTHQLSVLADGSDGLVVSVFRENSTDVFAGGGFASSGRMGPVYTYGNQNAFVSIYVPLADPTAALAPGQIDKLAYGDCTPAALMPRNGSGTICMAGWVAYDANGNPGPGGTMRGTWPITQSIVAMPVPEPESYALMLVGLTLTALAARRRKTLSAIA